MYEIPLDTLYTLLRPAGIPETDVISSHTGGGVIVFPDTRTPS